MKKIKIITGILLIFLSGLVIGGIGTRLYTRHQIEKLVKGGPPPHLMPRLLRRLSDDLRLTRDQQVKVKEIGQEMAQELADLRRRYHPELRAIIDRHFDRIKAVLPREKHEQLEHARKRLERWRPRHKRPP